MSVAATLLGAEPDLTAPQVRVQIVADEPFLQEYREPFVRSSQAAENQVRALVRARQGRLWIASDAGLRVLDVERRSSGWHEPPGAKIEGPAFDLALDRQGTLWIAAWDGLYRVAPEQVERAPQVAGPLSVVHARGETLYCGGPRGLWRLGPQGFLPHPGAWATTFQDLLELAPGELWIATHIGLYRARGAQVERLASVQQLTSGNVRALAADPDGRRLWIGSSGGLDGYADGERLPPDPAAATLPSSDIRSLVFDAQGTLWMGTGLGVFRRDKQGRGSLRHSLRWLPNDEVRDVALGPEGAWVGTADGLALLRQRRMTLDDKAAHFREILRLRHVRPPGLVEKCRLAAPGDTKHFFPYDTDNDGMYTAMYAAAECFRYAATQAEDARTAAREAYRAVEFLQTVTGTPGFIARTVVPHDWAEPVADANRVYPPQEIALNLLDDPRWKYVAERWRASADGQWRWKGDTSSDEMGGHFFLFGVYYDLVADTAERVRVAEHVRRIADGLLAGGYRLRDLDGQATYWGVWDPASLNDDPNWRPDRGVNSVQILSFLTTARHITGDDRYEQALAELLSTHHYSENILEPQSEEPASFTHIDSQLLALAYRALFAYETDPARRALYAGSRDRWFQAIRRDRSPYFAVTHAACGGSDADWPACVAALRDAPWDLVLWTVDQRRREDVRLVRHPSVERWQVDRLLPPSERAILKWDSSPYADSAGEEGHFEGPGTSWLLPYWMARYYGLLAPPAEDRAPNLK